MKLPSKITSYKESVLGKLIIVLEVLVREDITVLALYESTKKQFSGIEEFIDTLDCLVALKKIALDKESGVLHYVA